MEYLSLKKSCTSITDSQCEQHLANRLVVSFCRVSSIGHIHSEKCFFFFQVSLLYRMQKNIQSISANRHEFEKFTKIYLWSSR